MTDAPPPRGPSTAGHLEVGDGQRIWFEVHGNPAGKPVMVLHGGPGSGLSATVRAFYDPAVWRVIQFDQRGCGRSLPHASDPATLLADNTTRHLVEDIGRLADHLGLGRFLLHGGSWGATLGLAFAETYPERVAGLVLVGVTTSRRSEIRWLTRDIAPLFPAEFEAFQCFVPEAEWGDLIEAFRNRLEAGDAALRLAAARAWHAWESATVSADPDAPAPARWSDPAYLLARARLVTHYFANGAFLPEGELLARADRLHGIPGALVQGRLDLQAPLVTAWELARAWPSADLTIVQGAGHAPSDAGMAEAIRAAVARMERIARW
jgi:proline iminopeptidase